MFTLSSLACGLSRSIQVLIAFRALQAVGGAMTFSISGAILYSAFPPQERGRAMGFLGSTVAVGSILGPFSAGSWWTPLDGNYFLHQRAHRRGAYRGHDD